MSNRTKAIILTIAVIQLILIIGLLALPSVVRAIPGRYRIWLQENQPALSGITEEVIQQVAPVATALPAPAQSAAETDSQVDISALIASNAGGQSFGVASAPGNTAAEATAVAASLSAAIDEATPTPEPVSAPPTAATPTLAATAQPTATPEPTVTPTLEPLPAGATLEGMGVVKQSFNNCGPANLTQVLNWYGSDITQEDVAAYLKPNPEDRNVSPWQIADFVNEQNTGFKAIARAGGSMELLKRFVAAGYPVVIEKGYDLPESGWWGHYLTVYGYDDAKQEIYSQDSYLGPFDGSGRTDPYDEFEHFWQQFNHTFYVVYRPEQEAEVNAILGADMLDNFTMWQQVAAQAEAQTRGTPDDPFAWYNLGTALTRMGFTTGEARYYQGGAQAFDKAREIGLPPRMLWYQFEPYLAYLKLDRYQDVVDLADATLETQGGRNVEETFWYKGHALAYLGDIQGAISAYKQALEVNENFYPAQWSLDSLQPSS